MVKSDYLYSGCCQTHCAYTHLTGLLQLMAKCMFVNVTLIFDIYFWGWKYSSA